MNSGMPNASKLMARTLLTAGGVTGIFGWILGKVLEALLSRGSQQVLIMMDKGHMVMVVSGEKNEFNKENDGAWAIVDQGKTLTKEEIDAIDKPVLDAFIKLATFNKLRKPSKNT